MTICEQLERRVGEVVRRVITELPPDLRQPEDTLYGE